jgi:DNA-binding FadR family transcriptional regulator
VLAISTQNELYNILMTPITELLLEFRLTAYRMNKEGAVDGALTYHREILDCIKARDPEGARRAMRLHLDQAEKLIEAAYSYAKD